MKKIITVATQQCLEGYNRLVASHNKTQKIPLVTYTTNDTTAVPVGIQLARFWENRSRISRTANPPAALKPLAILDAFEKGASEVLFVDGADVLLFEDVGPLFDLCKDHEIGGYSFDPNKLLEHRERSVLSAFSRYINHQYPYINNGIVYYKNTPYVRMMMLAWLAKILVDGPRFLTKRLVGDQEDLNIFVREAHLQGKFIDIGEQWNCRGHRAQTLKIENGKVFNENGLQIYIGHSSGQESHFPKDVIEWAITNSSLEVIQ